MNVSNAVGVLLTVTFPIIFLVLSELVSSDSESPNATTLLTMTFVLPPAVAEPLNLKDPPLTSAVNVINELAVVVESPGPPVLTSLYVVMYASEPSCINNASMLPVSPVD